MHTINGRIRLDPRTDHRIIVRLKTVPLRALSASTGINYASICRWLCGGGALDKGSAGTLIKLSRDEAALEQIHLEHLRRHRNGQGTTGTNGKA